MNRSASVQFNHHAGDKAYNLGRIQHFCEQASRENVQIIAFPEMCISGYWHVNKLSRDQVADLAETVPDGESTQAIMEFSRRYHMTVGAGLIEEADGEFYNAYVVAEPDGSVHVHRKLHCFVSPHMSSGDEYTVFESVWGCKIGVLICWDNNLIENVRATALLGADILMAPHQTGGTNSRSPEALGRIDPQVWLNRHNDPELLKTEVNGRKGREWLMRWLPSRAHDNGLFILFANGIGLDDDEVRTGNSMIIDCYGRIMTEVKEPDDEMVIADLDLDMLPLCTGRRWMRGRRPDLYGILSQSTGAEFAPREARFSEKPTSKK